jgi:hypothetical protein
VKHEKSSAISAARHRARELRPSMQSIAFIILHEYKTF